MKSILAIAITLSVLTGCSSSDDIGEFNGKTVSQEQFDAYMEYKALVAKNPEQAKTVKNDYLLRRALADQIESEETLDMKLVQAEIDNIRTQLLINKYFDEYLKDKASDDAVRNYYQMNEQNYQSEEIQIAHVLIRTNRKMTEKEIEAAKVQARLAKAELDDGVKFDQVVSKYSQDKMSKPKQGSLGWIKKGAIDPIFSDTAFSLEKDQVSQVIKTPYGFHILKALDNARVNKRTFDSVKGDIRYKLRQQAKKAEEERLMKEISYEVYEG